MIVVREVSVRLVILKKRDADLTPWRVAVRCEGTDRDLHAGELIDAQAIRNRVAEFHGMYLPDHPAFRPSGSRPVLAPTAENFAGLLLKTIPRCVRVILDESEDSRVEVSHV